MNTSKVSWVPVTVALTGAVLLSGCSGVRAGTGHAVAAPAGNAVAAESRGSSSAASLTSSRGSMSAPGSIIDTGTSVASCATGNLRLTAGPTFNAAGSRYTTFYLTNNSRSTCTMQGFPGVSVLDAAGHMAGQPARWTGPAGQPTLVRPAQRAQFTLQNSVATQTGCLTPRPSTQIRVYPPNQRAALTIAFPTRSCTLYVSAVTAAH